MNHGDLQARIHRLRQLADGLAREAFLWKNRPSPFDASERDEYLDALAIAGASLTGARLVLIRACQRPEEVS